MRRAALKWIVSISLASAGDDKIGIFTGSFDPPHSAHERIARELQSQFDFDKLYIVPDSIAEYKSGKQGLVDREQMVRLLFEDSEEIGLADPLTASNFEMGGFGTSLMPFNQSTPRGRYL